jgi:SET domain-containing protein
MMKRIIDSVKKNCNVHLRPSTVCDGVGVFALVDIKKGTKLFADIKPDTDFILFDETLGLPEEVITYLKSMCNNGLNGIYLSRTVSSINLSYYVNHSDDFNVVHDLDIDIYVTTRNIKKGEEILCKYNESEIDW